MTTYNELLEEKMRLYYSQLSEKDKRHYASLEAEKLGYGGKQYLCHLLGVSQKTLRKGIAELSDASLYAEIPLGKQRRVGGGRKKKLNLKEP